MLRRYALLIVGLAVLLSLYSISSAQPNLSSNPASLLDSARQKNGLAGSDLRPWHIHGTYKIYDAKGNTEDEGVYEEWWLNPTVYKTSFSSPHFTQTDNADGSSLSRDGEQEWSSGFQLSLREQLINPLPPSNLTKDMQLAMKDTSKLRCISMVYQLRQNLRVAGNFFPSVCLDLTAPLLRISSPGSSNETIYNNLVTFQGRYVAKQLQVFQSEKLRAELNLDSIELLSNPTATLFTPPSTARTLDLASISFGPSSMQAFPMALAKAAPEYPQVARATRIAGIVKIRATVAADGHVRSTAVLDGPDALRQSAENAVSQWTYWPLVVLGRPRPFSLEVKVIFQMR
jgi:TonB family protein